MTRTSEVDFRLVVGSAGGPCSSVWRGFSTKNDVYLSQGDMGRIEKFSFHKSLICRHAFTDASKPAGMSDRVIHRWRRAPTAPAGANGIAYALTASFPTDVLSTAHPMESKPVTWIAAAPAGRITVVEFVFTQENQQAVETIAAAAQRKLISYTRLPNGDAFVVSSTSGEWKGENFTAAVNFQKERDFVVSREDPERTGRPARFTTFNQPKDGEPMLVWEYGAYTVPKGTIFDQPMGKFTSTTVLHAGKKK